MKPILKCFILLLFSSFCSASRAQEISFDKKSGEFSANGAVIAKLEDERVKGLGGKSYFLKDASGSVELLAFLLHKWEDTLGDDPIFYYSIRSTPIDRLAYRRNFTGMLNTFKEVGEMIVAKNILLPTGRLNEPATRSYFDTAMQNMGDYPKRIREMQDSMVALVSIDAPPVERDLRKPITANQYGKIGQGNTVIGTWELIQTSGPGLGASDKYHFRIKNLAGGIVCISWVSLSGAHTYAYKGGARSKEDWRGLDLINNNPLQNKEAYVVSLATQLVRMGLL